MANGDINATNTTYIDFNEILFFSNSSANVK